MFLFAVSIHVGIQGGGDLVRRWVVDKNLEDLSDHNDPTGEAADLPPCEKNITKRLKTPWVSKICGSAYVGIGFAPIRNTFIQFNGHIGMTGLHEEYFSMPLFVGLECMTGLYLNSKIITGISGGLEMVGYQPHKFDVTFPEGMEGQKGSYKTQPLDRLQSLSWSLRYFVGPFIGIQIHPSIRCIGRLQIAPFITKKEKEEYNYSFRQDANDVEGVLKGNHTVQHGGVRALIGFEFMKNFKKTMQQ